MRQCDRHRAGTGARFDNFFARPDAHRHEDEADIFWIKDLRVARQIIKRSRKRGLKQKERRADMTEDLRAPELSDQIIVLQNAAVSFEPCTLFESDNKVLVPQANQLGNITGTRVGGSNIEWHKFILLLHCFYSQQLRGEANAVCQIAVAN